MGFHSITDIRSKEELLAYLADGKSVEYLFFWGHTKNTDGEVGKTCLSQWYEAEFHIDGIRYSTAEHYMMAEKARLFKDDEALRKILESKQPADAKKLGRTVRNYDNEIWMKNRFGIVVRGNVAKFEQNEALKEFLIRTGTKVIVEASPRDAIWGIGLGQNNPDAADPAKWRGSNLLGFALMAVRKELA